MNWEPSEEEKIHKTSSNENKKKIFLDKLYSTAGESRLEEVNEVLRIGKLSWKLRDDDNILLGKLENQLLIFLNQGCEILISEGRMESKEDLILASSRLRMAVRRGMSKPPWQRPVPSQVRRLTAS